MFYILKTRTTIRIHPKHLGENLQREITRRVHKDYDGKFTDEHGYVFGVVHTEVDLESGLCDVGTGHVSYDVSLKAITFKPSVGDVVDAQVTSVAKTGIFARVGARSVYPLSVFVPRHYLGDDMQFETYPEARYFIPSHPRFQVTNGSEIRVRIKTLRVATREVTAVCMMNEDGLGPVVDVDGDDA